MRKILHSHTAAPLAFAFFAAMPLLAQSSGTRLTQLIAPIGSGSQFGTSTALSQQYSAAKASGVVYLYSPTTGRRSFAQTLGPGPLNPLATEFGGFGPIAINGDVLATTVGYFNPPPPGSASTIFDTSLVRYKLSSSGATLISRVSYTPQVRFFNVQLFPTAVAFTGDDVIIGFPFEKAPVYSPAGKIIGMLDPGSAAMPNVTQFGFAIATSGTTTVVSGAAGFGGMAFVFDRNQGGSNRFGLVKVISAPANDQTGFFGEAVAIEGDRVLVGSTLQGGTAYVYDRNQGGTNNFGVVRSVAPRRPGSLNITAVNVSVGASRVLVASQPFDSSPGVIYEYLQDQGGTDQYGQIDQFGIGDNGNAQLGAGLSQLGRSAIIGAPGVNGGIGAVYSARLR